jgi:hypothetical protein
MAVFTPNDENEWYKKPTDCCLYCGRRISGPCIWWRGDTTEVKEANNIWLHPECAIQLMIRISRDIHEIQIKTNTRFEPVLGSDK